MFTVKIALCIVSDHHVVVDGEGLPCVALTLEDNLLAAAADFLHYLTGIRARIDDCGGWVRLKQLAAIKTGECLVIPYVARLPRDYFKLHPAYYWEQATKLLHHAHSDIIMEGLRHVVE